MKKHKILVTGSAGFIGSHLVDHLLSMGHLVYGVDDLSGGFMRNVKDKKLFKKLDLRDRYATADYIRHVRPDIIFHLAADATEGRSQFTPFSAVDRNLLAYINLLVPAISSGLKKMILVSSMSVYGKQPVPFNESMDPKPEDVYGISKASMESITRIMSDVYGFEFVIIRPHNVYGPRQNLSDPYRNVIGIFINRLMQGKPYFIYGDGLQIRAFSYIDDVVPAMAKSAFLQKASGHIFNIGSDDHHTIAELSNHVLKVFFEGKEVSKKLSPKYVPLRPQEVKYAYSSHDMARKILGFKPKTDLEIGLTKMLEWAKEIGPQKFVYLKDLELTHKNTPATWTKRLI